MLSNYYNTGLLEPEFFGNILISLGVFLHKVKNQSATLTDHAQKTSPGMNVFFVSFQMLSQLCNFFRQQSDLHFRGSGVSLPLSKFLDDALF